MGHVTCARHYVSFLALLKTESTLLVVPRPYHGFESNTWNFEYQIMQDLGLYTGEGFFYSMIFIFASHKVS